MVECVPTLDEQDPEREMPMVGFTCGTPPFFFLESCFCGQEAVPSSGCDGEMEMIVRWPIGSVCGFAH